MKIKYIVFIIFILLISNKGYSKISVKIGPTAAMFNSSDNNLKEIYGGNDFIYGFKIGVKIWKGFSGWLTGYFYNADSKVSYTKEEIKYNSNTFGINIRYTLPIKWSVKPYLSLGYINVSFKENGEDPTVENISGSSGGYSLMLGFDFKINKRFSFEFETKYDSAIANPTGFDVELGGFSTVASFLIRIF